MPTQTATRTLQLQAAAPSFTVNDVEKSIAFYRDVLGFEVKERWEENGKLMGAELSAGDVTFMIGQDDWKKGRDRAKGQGFRIYCSTDEDIDAVARDIESRGGKLDDGPSDNPWGRAFDLTDPDGFKITIGQEREEEEEDEEDEDEEESREGSTRAL